MSLYHNPVTYCNIAIHSNTIRNTALTHIVSPLVHKHISTQTRTCTVTQSHRHTQTHTDTDTQTQTHRHRHTQTQTQTQTQTHTHTRVQTCACALNANLQFVDMFNLYMCSQTSIYIFSIVMAGLYVAQCEKLFPCHILRSLDELGENCEPQNDSQVNIQYKNCLV